MKLYKISQDKNNNYDTYDSAIVAAEREEEARKIHPSQHASKAWDYIDKSSWVESPDDVYVQEIGTATKGTKAGVICASFNAGLVMTT